MCIFHMHVFNLRHFIKKPTTRTKIRDMELARVEFLEMLYSRKSRECNTVGSMSNTKDSKLFLCKR